ncbi:hypothetical protein HanIR_Chr09g0396261 [Helianthus annuus]|nr:hypothetical protein HanIR_Chr09g0396261 [Helianthus annuus]
MSIKLETIRVRQFIRLKFESYQLMYGYTIIEARMVNKRLGFITSSCLFWPDLLSNEEQVHLRRYSGGNSPTQVKYHEYWLRFASSHE